MGKIVITISVVICYRRSNIKINLFHLNPKFCDVDIHKSTAKGVHSYLIYQCVMKLITFKAKLHLKIYPWKQDNKM